MSPWSLFEATCYICLPENNTLLCNISIWYLACGVFLITRLLLCLNNILLTKHRYILNVFVTLFWIRWRERRFNSIIWWSFYFAFKTTNKSETMNVKVSALQRFVPWPEMFNTINNFVHNFALIHYVDFNLLQRSNIRQQEEEKFPQIKRSQIQLVRDSYERCSVEWNKKGQY